MSLSITSGGAGSSAGATVANAVCTLSSSLQIGSIVVVGIAATTTVSAPAFTVTDNLGNTYISTGARVVQNLETVELFFCIVTATGVPTITVTPSGNAILDLAAFQFTSNVAGSIFAFNAKVQGANNNATASLGGLLAVAPPDLAIAWLGTKAGTSTTIPSSSSPGLTNAFKQNGSTANGYSFDYNLAQSTPQGSTWSLSATTNWGALIVNFTVKQATVLGTTFHRIDFPRSEQFPNSFYNIATRQPIPTFISTVPSKQPGQYRPDLIPDFTPWVTPKIKILPPPVAVPPIAPAPTQRFDSLPDLYTWWEQFRLQPLFTLLPTPFPQQHDQRFDDFPDLFPYWEQFLRLSPPTFLPTPFPQQDSQRWDALPDYTSWWEQFTRQPIPITFLPAPFPQQRSQRFDPLPDLTSWWEQLRFQPTPITFLPTPFPQQRSQRFDQLPDFNLSWWEQFKIFTTGAGAVVERPAIRQPDQRFDPLPVLTSWWEQFRFQPVPITFVVTPFLRQKDQRFDPLPNIVSLWWQQHPYVFQSIQVVHDAPKPRQPLFVYFEPANNFFGWWEQVVVTLFPLLPPTPQLVREMLLVNRVPDATTGDGKRRLDRFTEIVSQAFNYLQMIGRLRLTGIGKWDIQGVGSYAVPTSPTVFDDVRFGYTPGALWVNTLTQQVFVLISNTTGSANWQLVGTGSGLTGTFP